MPSFILLTISVSEPLESPSHLVVLSLSLHILVQILLMPSSNALDTLLPSSLELFHEPSVDINRVMHKGGPTPEAFSQWEESKVDK